MITLFLKDFTVLDFAFFEPKEGLQGESFFVSAELEGELDAHGFLFDFGPAKKVLKAAVDDFFDHRFLFQEVDAQKEASGLRFGELLYRAPAESYAAFPEPIRLAYLEKAMADKIFPLLPKNVSALRILLREEEKFKEVANFRYTHGLRFHNGNCQRLFHGHRNPLEVWLDGERDTAAEFALAKHWQNAHFAPMETIVNAKELDLSLGRHACSGQAKLRYQSPQGDFYAEIPARKLFVMQEEPSIENIAKAGCEWLRQQGVRGVIKVVAYEGLNKGASYRSN